MRHIVVVNHPKKWPLNIPGVDVVAARTYLSDENYSRLRRVKVYNLCKSYRYQTTGYYVSLLASARGHRPMPNILAMQDMKSQAMIRFASEEMEKLVRTALRPIQADRFVLSIYFGKNMARRYDRICQRLFNQFQAPLLRAIFQKKEGEWFLQSISPIAASDIPEEHHSFVIDSAQEFFQKRSPSTPRKSTRFDLAILVNPDEEPAPSNEIAIRRFIKAAESLDLYTELITKEDYSRLNEFDALFIRETTSVNHHTYRMARKAVAEGLVVIDDPESILKCTNKVYLAELLTRYNIPAPKTLILSLDNRENAPAQLGFPLVLKQPDSSFSKGVMRIENHDEFMLETDKLFTKSDLLIAQEFIPTNFDWRVGILNNKPLYSCHYYMARKHWQIYERLADGKTYEGLTKTFTVEETPENVITLALRAAGAIGDGLYGVDIKQVENKLYVIEVNDNPSIDAGIEDCRIKSDLYESIMGEILRRIEIKKRGSDDRD